MAHIDPQGKSTRDTGICPDVPISASGDCEARQALRVAMRRQRAAQPPAQAARLGLQAQERLMASTLWRHARSVALYVSARGELPTDTLLHVAWHNGWTVWLPRVKRGIPGVMDFVICHGPADLAPGAFNLREPLASLPGSGPDDPALSPDLVVLPGLAFDRSGGRLGQGGGYYDRFLALGLHCPRVGLCFDFQLVDTLPLAPWDQRVHAICTEGQLLCP